MKLTYVSAGVILGLMLGILMVVLAISMRPSYGGEQTRIYDSRGNSLGTAAPQSDGSTRYYDSRGKSLGTSTTTGGTTTFYGPSGNVTGKSVVPGRK